MLKAGKMTLNMLVFYTSEDSFQINRGFVVCFYERNNFETRINYRYEIKFKQTNNVVIFAIFPEHNKYRILRNFSSLIVTLYHSPQTQHIIWGTQFCTCQAGDFYEFLNIYDKEENIFEYDNKAILMKLRNISVSLRRWSCRLWIWLSDRIEKSIRVLENTYWHQQREKKIVQGIMKKLASFMRENFHVSLKISRKSQSLNMSLFPTQHSHTKKENIITIFCPGDAARFSLHYVSADRLIQTSVNQSHTVKFKNLIVPL